MSYCCICGPHCRGLHAEVLQFCFTHAPAQGGQLASSPVMQDGFKQQCGVRVGFDIQNWVPVPILLPPSPQSSPVEEADQACGRWSGISRMPSQYTDNELLLTTDDICDLLDSEVGSCEQPCMHTMPLTLPYVSCCVCAAPSATHSRHRHSNHESPALETALHSRHGNRKQKQPPSPPPQPTQHARCQRWPSPLTCPFADRLTYKRASTPGRSQCWVKRCISPHRHTGNPRGGCAGA